MLQLIIKTVIMCSHENYTLGVEIVDMVILQTIMMIILTYMWHYIALITYKWSTNITNSTGITL